jgi:hypothetical protein
MLETMTKLSWQVIESSPNSAYGGTTNRSIPRGGHTLVDSVEVCNHLLLGKRFEGVKAEAASFEGRASVRGNQLVVEFRGDRQFYRSRD